ncbi:MAG TPA: ABC transporter ATP-binding protein [Planctomycetota bacterium]|nr:ABC transporter ATP-binding protein [Planctomycetota bacterium]
MTLLSLRDVTKSYPVPGGGRQEVLRVAQFDLGEREQVALAGTSGSGKTTFLNIIAGILKPDGGRVLLGGRDLVGLTEAQRDVLRAENLGYVFQTFHLLGAYSALENVVLGMAFGPGPDPQLARVLLERLGLGNRLHHRPHQLSVGQQQRVALARALANRPKLVLADEPTGNLDPESGLEALGLIRAMCAESGAALLLVSHDPKVLATFERCQDFAELNQARGEVPA